MLGKHRNVEIRQERRRWGTKLLSFSSALSLIFVGLVGVAIAPAAQAEETFPFCHATASTTNPYKYGIDTGLDSFKQGHGSHVGPVFPAANWGDIFPPNSFRPEGQNWDAIGQAIYNNGCKIDIPVTPIAPLVVEAECVAPGQPGLPSITLASTANISYSLNGTVAAGQTVTVIASPVPPEVFTMTAPAGWVLNRDGTATYTVTFAIPNCTFDAAPAPPEVVQAFCTAPGVASAPSLTLVAVTGVSYQQMGTVAQGGTVTIMATPVAGYQLTAAEGWTLNPDGTATYTVTFETVNCIVQATPVDPTVVQAVCTGPGTATTPTLDLATTLGINYVLNGTVAQGNTITVTATPLSGYTLAAAAGWVPNGDGSASLTFTVHFKTVDCIERVTPVDPTVLQAVCTGPGTATTPTLDLATTVGISYSSTGTVAQGSTVVVTGAPQTGYSLTPAAGWVANSDGSASYTFTVEFDVIDCTVTATPVPPLVTQSECTGPGLASIPTLEFASTAGITYSRSADPATSITVTVTATPKTGYRLGAAEGWTLQENGTATFTVSFTTPYCIEKTVPEPPVVEQAKCTGPGTASTPTLTFAETAGITYSRDVDPATGITVTVKATPMFGYTLSASTGWTIAEDGTATFTVMFSTPDCIQGTDPGTPTATQAQCTAPGTASKPSLGVPADSDSISYTVEGTVAQGATVYVIATAAEGYKLNAGNGWSFNEDGTASFKVVFSTVNCILDAEPIAPEVTQAVCTGPGTASTPTVKFATTTGITYNQDIAPAAGATVVVTATPNFGYVLTAGDGWTLKEDGTATFTVTLSTPDCIEGTDPGTPTATQAECTAPGIATMPKLNVPANTDSISYSVEGTVAQGATVYVIATAAEGYKLNAGNGWSFNEDGTASYKVVFSTVNCIENAQPIAPAVTQALCTGPGTATTPTLTFAETAGITYSQDIEPAAGATVIVTATPNSGYVLTAGDGWTLKENGTATFTVIFSTPDCIDGTDPGTPTATQAECTAPGTASMPKLNVPANTDSISYTVEGTVAQGATVYVIATPAEGYKLNAGNGWSFNEDGTASYKVVFSTVNCIEEAEPIAPAVTQALCTGPGTASTPTLTFAETAGITYSQDIEPAAGATVIVTATPNFGYVLTAGNGWTLKEDGTATFTVTLSTPDCIENAQPIAPTVTQAKCTGPGTATTPTLTFVETAGITYSQDIEPAAGATVVVTATPNFGYVLTAGDGWTLKEDGTATFTVMFSTPDCIQGTDPGTPTAAQAKCTGPGTASTPTLNVPKNTDSISYTVEGTVEQGATVYVIASAAEGYKLNAGNGWSFNEDGTASYKVVFSTVNCIEDASPQTPTFEQQVCTDPGASTGPSMNVPADTAAITYTVDGTATAGTTVTITATPKFGYRIVLPSSGFALMAVNGWTLNEDGTATYTFSFDHAPDCIVDTEPATPELRQAVCWGPGNASRPRLYVPEDSESISYTVEGTVRQGATVYVIATPAEGYRLNEAEDWEMNEDGTATFTARFWTRDCIVEAEPVAPDLTQAVCTGPGTATTPELEFASTEGITYTQDSDAAAGSTVVVTATPDEGYELTETDGWEMDEDGTATFTAEFRTPDCIVGAEPLAPDLTQAVCTGPGTATTPELAFATTEGITYTQYSDIAAGATVLVTATPNEGYELTETDGWTMNEDGTATFTAKFSTPDCVVAATPAAPAATQAVCTNGTVSTPTLTLATTKGISYTTAGAVANGKSITVTATPAEGYALANAANWTGNKDGTATLTGVFTNVSCPVPVVEAVMPLGQAVMPLGQAAMPLAMTGLGAGWSLPLGALFLVVGAGAVWRSRRPADG